MKRVIIIFQGLCLSLLVCMLSADYSHLLQILWLYFYDHRDFVNNFINIAQKLAPCPKGFLSPFCY